MREKKLGEKDRHIVPLDFYNAMDCALLPGVKRTCATLIFANSDDVLCGVYLW